MRAFIQTDTPVPLPAVAGIIESGVNQGWDFVCCFQSGMVEVRKSILAPSNGNLQVMPSYTIVFSREYMNGVRPDHLELSTGKTT